jgi:signal transduction histidine kinase/CheY-like chemotaxis protein
MPTEARQREDCLLNRLPLGVFVLDRDGRFTFINDHAGRFFQALSGQPPAELLGQNIWESCPEVADSSFARAHQQAMAGTHVFELEAYYPALQRWFLILASSSEEGQCFSLQDVTAQKRLEVEFCNHVDQLSAAINSRAEFLLPLAHEIRDCLAVMRNTFYLVRHAPESAARAVAAGEQCVAELTTLTGDLVKLSQLLLGRVSANKEQVDLIQTVTQAAEAILSKPQAHGRTLTLGLPAGPLLVWADAEQLGDAVYHLLESSLSFTQAGNQIWVSAENQHGQVLLHVEDDGVGIAAELLPRIFDLFASGESGGGQTQVRLRTALALVHGLIELQGGSIQAGSEGPGRGSEFIVTLPALAAAPPAAAQPVSGASQPGRQVLVVDNNQQAADSLALLLRLWGYESRVVYDGPAALREAATWRPQIVVLDLAMPGMDGYEVAQLLRQTSDPPVLVAITGMSSAETRQKALDAGFDYFTVKPMVPEELKGLLQAATGPVLHG